MTTPVRLLSRAQHEGLMLARLDIIYHNREVRLNRIRQTSEKALVAGSIGLVTFAVGQGTMAHAGVLGVLGCAAMYFVYMDHQAKTYQLAGYNLPAVYLRVPSETDVDVADDTCKCTVRSALLLKSTREALGANE